MTGLHYKKPPILYFQILAIGLILALVSILVFGFVVSKTIIAASNDWTDKSSGLSGEWASSLVVNPSNSNIIYVSMYGGGVFKSTNAADSWISINNGLNTSESKQIICLTIDESNPSTLYVGTNQAEIYKTTDGGGSWKLANEGISPGFVFYTQIYCLAIDPSNSSRVYAATTGGIYKSSNAGVSWSLVGSRDSGLTNTYNKAVVVNPSNPLIIYAASQKGVFKSTNGGSAWVSVGPSDQYVHTLAIDPYDYNIIYAGTSDGVFKSVDGGTTWTNTSLVSEYGYTPSVKDIAIISGSPSTLYAASNLGVFKSPDGGVTWSELEPSTLILFWSSNALAIDLSGPITLYSAADGWADEPGGFVWSWTDTSAPLPVESPAEPVSPGEVTATFVIGQSSYTLNGVTTTMDAASYIKNGRTYVPVRYLAYSLEIDEGGIGWDSGTQTVTLTKEDKMVTLTIGSKTRKINDVSDTMDVAPEISNGRTMLPARWVAEAFDATVGWDSGLRTVTITY